MEWAIEEGSAAVDTSPGLSRRSIIVWEGVWEGGVFEDVFNDDPPVLWYIDDDDIDVAPFSFSESFSESVRMPPVEVEGEGVVRGGVRLWPAMC